MNRFSLNILAFPFWWYTVGTGLVWGWFKKQWHFSLHKTGLLLFARHMNEPLYGDYTRTGRIMSFFLRIFVLVYKLVIFVLRMIIASLMLILFLALPALILIMIVFQLLSL